MTDYIALALADQDEWGGNKRGSGRQKAVGLPGTAAPRRPGRLLEKSRTGETPESRMSRMADWKIWQSAEPGPGWRRRRQRRLWERQAGWKE